MTRDKGDLCAEHKRSRVAAGARLPGGEEKGKWTKLSYRANGTLSYTFPPTFSQTQPSFDSVDHLYHRLIPRSSVLDSLNIPFSFNTLNIVTEIGYSTVSLI